MEKKKFLRSRGSLERQFEDFGHGMSCHLQKCKRLRRLDKNTSSKSRSSGYIIHSLPDWICSNNCLNFDSQPSSSISIILWSSLSCSSYWMKILTFESIFISSTILKGNYQFIRGSSYHVRVVHSSSVVRKSRADPHGGFIIPVRQKVILSVITHRFDCRSRTVPGGI